MPYVIRKIRNKNSYKVVNPITKFVHSYGTTKKKAESQIRLLYSIKQKRKQS